MYGCQPLDLKSDWENLRAPAQGISVNVSGSLTSCCRFREKIRSQIEMKDVENALTN